jgi:hypothetical protein
LDERPTSSGKLAIGVMVLLGLMALCVLASIGVALMR